MATNNNLKKEDIKPTDNLNLTEEQIRMMEDEFNKKQRQKVKESINRVLRVVGLFASFILIYAGIFDALFELSYFGFIWDKIAQTDIYTQAWLFLCQQHVYDDPLGFGTWIAKLMITIIVILAALGIVYLLTYNIADLIGVIKGFIKAGRDITVDLGGNVREGVKDELGSVEKQPKKKKKKNLFENDDGTKVKPEKIEKDSRRKAKDEVENSSLNFANLSDEEIDRLLKGENIDEKPSDENNEENKN